MLPKDNPIICQAASLKLPASVQKLVFKFAKDRHKLKDSKWVRGRCGHYSAALADRLLEQNHIFPKENGTKWEVMPFELSWGNQLNKIYPRRYPTNHYVFRFETILVDLTARQFSPLAPIPLFTEMPITTITT